MIDLNIEYWVVSAKQYFFFFILFLLGFGSKDGVGQNGGKNYVFYLINLDLKQWSRK